VNTSSRRLEWLNGRRQLSVAALRERAEAQYAAEAPPTLQIADADPQARRIMLAEILEYLLELESIRLTREERLRLLDDLYSDLFQYGPLDPIIMDRSVVEISIKGDAFARTRDGQQTRLDLTLDEPLLRAIVERMIATTWDAPFIETGAILHGRRARITAAQPPATTIGYNVQIRLHGEQPALDALIEERFLAQSEADALRVAVSNRQGVMIVGEVGSGKTTLLGALIGLLPATTAIIERAGELPRLFIEEGRPVPYMGPDFAAQIERARAANPAAMVLDEIRFDESQALWDLLRAYTPTLLAAVRGGRPDRLYASLSMSVLRAQPGTLPEAIAERVAARFPVVVLLGRSADDGRLHIRDMGAWVRDADRVIFQSNRR